MPIQIRHSEKREKEGTRVRKEGEGGEKEEEKMYT